MTSTHHRFTCVKKAHLFPDNITFVANFMDGLRKFRRKEENTIFVFFEKIPERLQRYSDLDIRAVSTTSGLLKTLNEFDEITFHSLYPHYLHLIPKLNNKTLNWVFWGYEYYNYFETELYEPLTNKLVPKKSILKMLAQRLRKFQLVTAMKCIDNFLFWDRSFFKKLKKQFTLKAEFKEFLYCKSFLEPITLTNSSPRQSGDCTCYVGNSGDLSGNQPDVFQTLSKTLGITKVYSLLAYGKSKHLKIIENYGDRKLGIIHHPIRNFLPRNQYLNTMNEVDIIICYHSRMQALGLIFNAILIEKILVLNPKNNFTTLINNLGIIIFYLKDL